MEPMGGPKPTQAHAKLVSERNLAPNRSTSSVRNVVALSIRYNTSPFRVQVVLIIK